MTGQIRDGREHVMTVPAAARPAAHRAGQPVIGAQWIAAEVHLSGVGQPIEILSGFNGSVWLPLTSNRRSARRGRCRRNRLRGRRNRSPSRANPANPFGRQNMNRRPDAVSRSTIPA